MVVGRGLWDSGGMDANNNHDGVSDDDNNNGWHYWRSYGAMARFLHFPLYSPLANLDSILGPHFTDEETKEELKMNEG